MESIEFRLQKLDVDKEDTERELKDLQLTLEKAKRLLDEVKANSTARDSIKAFIKDLEKQIEMNTGILDEIQQGIEFVSNLDNLKTNIRLIDDK